MITPNVALPKQTMKPEQLLAACKRDPFWFCKYILGYNLMSDCQWDILQEVQRAKRSCILAPRGHLKTTAMSVGYSLWLLSQDHSLKLFFGSESGGKASNILDEVRAHLQTSEALNWYDHELVRRYQQARYDRGTEFKFNPIAGETISKDPTASARGAGSAATSGHYEVIIADDLNDLNDKYSERLRRGKWEWFRELENLINPGGTVINIQTRWHEQDVAGQIIGKSEGITDPRCRGFGDGKREYRVVIYDMNGGKLVREPYSEEWTKSQMPTGDGLLFPLRFHSGNGNIVEGGIARKGVKDLKADRINFPLQYLNQITDREQALYKEEWFVPKPPPAPDAFKQIVVGVDWAFSDRDTAHYNALIAIGIDYKAELWILDGEIWRRDKATAELDQKTRQSTMLVTLDDRVSEVWGQRPSTYYVERNGAQLGFSDEMERQTGLHFRAADVTLAKTARGEMQAAVWDEGRVHVSTTVRSDVLTKLREHYLDFPDGSFDDGHDGGGNAIIPVAKIGAIEYYIPDYVPNKDYIETAV